MSHDKTVAHSELSALIKVLKDLAAYPFRVDDLPRDGTTQIGLEPSASAGGVSFSLRFPDKGYPGSQAGSLRHLQAMC